MRKILLQGQIVNMGGVAPRKGGKKRKASSMMDETMTSTHIQCYIVEFFLKSDKNKVWYTTRYF
jgi:hypothetical protein